MKIAIKGHESRGKEIIQILRSLGATSYGIYDTCSHPEWYWYINKNREITCDPKSSMWGYKLYTLEEFEKEFPFKIGDEVKHITSVGTIKEYCYIDNEPAYKVKSIELGIIATIPVKILEPYKEMEKRNITLTLEKAKEWYKKGGELKEIALQAFTEKELTKVELPKTWEEFCENYPVKKGESWLGIQDTIHDCNQDLQPRYYKNWTPSKKSAEAHLAMMQLEQLRDCWRQEWNPTSEKAVYAIKVYGGKLDVFYYCTREFLSFPTQKMAEDFLVYFRDLIEKAGDLI